MLRTTVSVSCHASQLEEARAEAQWQEQEELRLQEQKERLDQSQKAAESWLREVQAAMLIQVGAAVSYCCHMLCLALPCLLTWICLVCCSMLMQRWFRRWRLRHPRPTTPPGPLLPPAPPPRYLTKGKGAKIALALMQLKAAKRVSQGGEAAKRVSQGGEAAAAAEEPGLVPAARKLGKAKVRTETLPVTCVGIPFTLFCT